MLVYHIRSHSVDKWHLQEDLGLLFCDPNVLPWFKLTFEVVYFVFVTLDETMGKGAVISSEH